MVVGFQLFPKVLHNKPCLCLTFFIVRNVGFVSAYLFWSVTNWLHHNKLRHDSQVVEGVIHRRRINTEEKAKVVVDVWGAKFVQFLAALQI